MFLDFTAGRNKDSSPVQPVENAHYAILACNLSGIIPKFYVVARFVIICLEPVRHVNLIDAVVLHQPHEISLVCFLRFIRYCHQIHNSR